MLNKIGVIGGGQLARMMILEARRMGYRVCVMAPEAHEPAVPLADHWIPGALDDVEAAKRPQIIERADSTGRNQRDTGGRRGGQFEQLTLDHSLLQELVDRGFYSAEEAQRSTNRNYVTRALGVEPTVEVEVHEHEVLPDDVYLLCSDGLPDMVEDEDIHLTISTFNASLDIVGKQLIELANDHGGRDNVSVQLAQVITPFAARKGILAKLAGVFRT